MISMKLRFSGDDIYLMPTLPESATIQLAREFSEVLAEQGQKTTVYTHPKGSDLRGTYVFTGKAVDLLQIALDRLGFVRPKEHFTQKKRTNILQDIGHYLKCWWLRIPPKAKIELGCAIQYDFMGIPLNLTVKDARKLIGELLMQAEKLDPPDEDLQEEWKNA